MIGKPASQQFDFREKVAEEWLTVRVAGKTRAESTEFTFSGHDTIGLLNPSKSNRRHCWTSQLWHSHSEC
jgi:hypothetical protein